MNYVKAVAILTSFPLVVTLLMAPAIYWINEPWNAIYATVTLGALPFAVAIKLLAEELK
jgi:uncharacterized membrane protein YhfC